MKALITVTLAMLLINVTVAATKDHPTSKGEQTHQRREPAIAIPFSGEVKATLWLPDKTTKEVIVTSHRVQLPSTGRDNYHALVVQQEQGNTLKAFIRYIYRHGKPSHVSTSVLVNHPKTRLEIIPAPIPREHNRYRTKQSWSFFVRFDNKALADHRIHLSTSHGSTLEAVTDQNGQVSFMIPDDFPDVIEGERDKRQAEFFLLTTYQHKKLLYQTTFAADYSLSLSHWQFSHWGVLVILAGFVSGRWMVSSKLNDRGLS